MIFLRGMGIPGYGRDVYVNADQVHYFHNDGISNQYAVYAVMENDLVQLTPETEEGELVGIVLWKIVEEIRKSPIPCHKVIFIKELWNEAFDQLHPAAPEDDE